MKEKTFLFQLAETQNNAFTKMVLLYFLRLRLTFPNSIPPVEDVCLGFYLEHFIARSRLNTYQFLLDFPFHCFILNITKFS